LKIILFLSQEMNKLILIELHKIFNKPRTYIGFVAIVLIVLAVQLGFYIEGEDLLDILIHNLKDQFIFQGKLINMYTVSYLIMNTLWIHVPILVALVTGDLIAGEANGGTFRMILTRPVSRTKLMIAKFIAGFTYSYLLIILLTILSLGFGFILFGKGDLVVLKTTINVFSAEDVFWRFMATMCYGILTMTTVAALSFLLSAISDNSLGPIIGTIAIIIGISIISTLGFSLLRPIIPYLFTTYLPSWQLFFDFEIDTGQLITAIVVQLVYILTFLGFTIIYFNRKDILT